MPEPEIRNPFLVPVDAPHVEQYFGVWCVQPEPFLAAVEQCQGMDVLRHVAEVQAAGGPRSSGSDRGYEMLPGGVAMLHVSGSLMKHVGSMSAGTSTVLLRRSIRQAVADEAVRAILLRIDSPGGTVAGTQDLADDVAAAARQKPVTAYIEDLGASAAYWVASQASRVYANRSGLVGSIGTFAVIQDLSGMAARLGVKVHVIRAGAHKGAGTPGTEISAEHLAEWQRVVNELNSHFLAGVSAGRRMSADRVAALADGRVHVGQAAVELGLIDGVRTLDETISELSHPSPKGTARMSQDHTAQVNATAQTPPPLPAQPAAIVGELLRVGPADYHELKRACVGADERFLCSQMDARATVEQAAAAWMAEQNRRLEAANQAAAMASARERTAGIEPVGTRAAGRAEPVSGDPRAQFDALVLERTARGQSRLEACQAVASENPELHQAYLVATNPGRKAQRLIAEKFE